MTLKLYEVHAIVYGQVQGVGFRATVRNYAQALKLCGTVTNCIDGSVEIYAQGSRESLEQLFRQIQNHFNIASIQLRYYSPSKPFKIFSIV